MSSLLFLSVSVKVVRHRNSDFCCGRLCKKIRGGHRKWAFASVYDRAMQGGLRLAKVKYEEQKPVELQYKNHYVGEGYPDLIVRSGCDRLVVELKAVSGDLGAAEEQQLRNYPRILGLNVGCSSISSSRGEAVKREKVEIREVVR
jgi:GxxExxY protein